MGFEPTRAEPIGLAVQRLNHSATSSYMKHEYYIPYFLSIQRGDNRVLREAVFGGHPPRTEGAVASAAKAPGRRASELLAGG